MSGVAWLSYLPVPGLAYVAVRLAPSDRLVRFHAWQGGILVGAAYVALFVAGLLLSLPGMASGAQAMGYVLGPFVLAVLVGCVVGAIGAVRGRYTRVRPAWDLAVRLHANGNR